MTGGLFDFVSATTGKKHALIKAEDTSKLIRLKRASAFLYALIQGLSTRANQENKINVVANQ